MLNIEDKMTEKRCGYY